MPLVEINLLYTKEKKANDSLNIFIYVRAELPVLGINYYFVYSFLGSLFNSC